MVIERRKSKLWEIVDFQYGYTASSCNEKIWPKFLRITDIVPDIIDRHKVPYCKIEEGKIQSSILEVWDIVIARTWATAGYAKLIRYLPEKTVFASYLIRVRVKEWVYSWFIWRIVESDFFKKFVETNKWWSAQPHANAPILKEFQISLPPLPTQQRIASILSNYDDLIEKNTRRIQILEEQAQALYRHRFVYFKFPWHEQVKMVDSETEFGMIPEGWEVKEIKLFWDVITWKTPSTTKSEYRWADMMFIKTPDMHWSVYCLQTSTYLSKIWYLSQKNKTLPKNSILVSCIWTLWVISITSEESQFNQQINAIIPNEECYIEYLYLNMKTKKQQLENLWSNGATMWNVNKDKFEKMEIIYPSKNLLTIFHWHVYELFEEILLLQKQNLNLKRQRNILLPRLMSGEILVNENM